MRQRPTGLGGANRSIPRDLLWIHDEHLHRGADFPAMRGGRRINQRGCTKLTTPIFLASWERLRWLKWILRISKRLTPESAPCRKRTKSRGPRWFVRHPPRKVGITPTSAFGVPSDLGAGHCIGDIPITRDQAPDVAGGAVVPERSRRLCIGSRALLHPPVPALLSATSGANPARAAGALLVANKQGPGAC